VEPFLSTMRPPALDVAGGAHDSDGWQVDTPWHFHDMHQILYAFDRSVDVEDKHGSHRIPHQFAAWIPAGAVHRTRFQKVRSGSVFLSADLVSEGGDRLRVIHAPALLREMVAYAKRWPLGIREDEDSRIYFECMARLCPGWIADEVRLVLPSCRDGRIEAAITRTRKSLATITLAELCKDIGMSERSLRRRFVQETGLSWEDYRRRLRVLEAIALLDKTTQTIGCIAAAVGYENQAAFARTFREAVGVGPSQYRKMKGR